MVLEDVRLARRKPQVNISCRIGKRGYTYPVYELSAQGFSFLCQKDSCPFQVWESLDEITISNGEGAEIISAAGTVVHVTEFDFLSVQVGVYFVKKSIDRSLSGTIRVPRRLPRVRLSALVSYDSNGNGFLHRTGVVRDFTATTARIVSEEPFPPKIEIGDEVKVVLGAEDKTLIQSPAHVVRLRADRSELILKFDGEVLDVASVEAVSQVLLNRNILDAAFESLEENRKVSDTFKALICDWQIFLQRLKRILDQEEAKKIYRTRREQELFLREIEGKVVEEFRGYVRRLNSIADKIPPGQNGKYKRYFRECLTPYFRTSPLVASMVDNDLGYPGDFETIKQFFQDPYAGDSLFGKIMNRTAVDLDAVTAHQDRIRFLEEELVSRYEKADGSFSFCSLGAGPAEEVLRFVGRTTFDKPVKAILLDMDAFALADFSERLQYLPKENFLVELININLLDVLRKKGSDPLKEKFQLTYCAGLFDYFSKSVCRRLLKYLVRNTLPGGTVITTNVHKNSEARHIMDYGLGWEIIHRNEKEMQALVPSGYTATFSHDERHTNIYMSIAVP